MKITCSKTKPKESTKPLAQNAKKRSPDQCPCCGEIWGLAIGLALGFGLWYHLHTMAPKHSLFSPTDMVGAGDAIGGFTTTFCEELHISASSHFKAFRLNHSPEIDKKHPEKFNFADTSVMEPYARVERSFYLLEGSSVKVDVCIDEFRHWEESIKALVFKGRDSFENWDNARTCDACAEQVHVINSRRHSCRYERFYTFHFEAKETDNYYVALLRNVSNPSATIVVKTKYELLRTKYDLQSAKVACKQGSVCNVKLDYASSQDVVVKFKKRNENLINLSTSCTKRIYFWAIVFGVIPFSAALFLSCCCCCICVEKAERKGSRNKKSTANETVPKQDIEAISGHFEKDTRVLLSPGDIPTYNSTLTIN